VGRLGCDGEDGVLKVKVHSTVARPVSWGVQALRGCILGYGGQHEKVGVVLYGYESVIRYLI